MNILLLTDRMESGGAETHIAQLARELQGCGHKVFLWTSGGRIADRLSQEGIVCILQPPPSRNPFRLLLRRIRLTALVKDEKIEVLHAHTRLTAQLIRRMKRKGYAEVVTVHARFFTNRFLSRAAYWGEKTIAVSEDLRKYVTKAYRLPPERVTVIPNGIAPSFFSPAPQKAPAHSILFASRLDHDCAKGAELLCSLAPTLFRSFPSLRIGIAGGGNAFEAISCLAENANRLMGRRVIVMHGQTDDMPSLLRSYRIFVGVSRAAIEAAACGCAVVLCGNEGYAGIWDASNSESASLSNFCARESRPASEKRLFRDLSQLLSNPARCIRAATESRAFVLARLDSQKTAQDTLAVYQNALPREYRHRITVGGYFGCGNLGDDAILQGFLSALRRDHPSVAVTVLSGAPRFDRKRLGVKTVHRKNPAAVLWQMTDSDLFILGGGSLLQNRTGNRSLAYYLWLLRLARLSGCPSVLFASGVGPILGARAKRSAASVLCHCRRIGLRDSDSLSALKSLGISEDRLFEGADAALLLPLPPPSRALFLRNELIVSPSVPLLGVVLHGGKALRRLRKSTVCAVHRLCRRHRMIPLFLVFDKAEDELAAKWACAECLDLHAKYTVPRTPSDALALLGSCRAVLSMRLHGIVLSARASVPTMGISTDPKDPKLASFARAAAIPCLPPKGTGISEILDAAEALLKENPAAERARSEALAEMQKKAQKDLANTLKIVYNKR